MVSFERRVFAYVELDKQFRFRKSPNIARDRDIETINILPTLSFASSGKEKNNFEASITAVIVFSGIP